MLHAVRQLEPAADYLLIDAVRLDSALPQQIIIHGDALSARLPLRRSWQRWNGTA